MIRVIFMAMLSAALLASAVHLPGLVWPLFIGILVMYVVGRLAGTTGPLKCPYCRKRVKLGATTCHHCGRDTVVAR